MNYSSRSRDSGFVLLEALVAAAILAIGLIVLAQFHTRLIQTSSDTRAAVEASHFAQQQLDLLRGLNWGDLDTVVAEPVAPIVGTAGREFAVFRALGGTVDDFHRLATVTVQVAGNAAVSATMQTLLSQSRFLALEAPRESPGDGRLIEGKYVEGEYGDWERGADGKLIAPNGYNGGGDGVVLREEDGQVVEIVSLESGDALEIFVDDEGNSRGYAKISGNLVFRIAPDGSGDPLAVLTLGLTGPQEELRRQYNLFDNLIAIRNGICTTFPSYLDFANADATLEEKLTARTALESDDFRYRVLGYSCYVANNWFGTISAVAPEAVLTVNDSICSGFPGMFRCDDDDPDCTLTVRVSDPGEGILGRSYIGFTVVDDESIEEADLGPEHDVVSGETRYAYRGIKGSPVFGAASFGSVCGTTSLDQGPLWCVDEGSFEGVEFHVPGGHHFLYLDMAETDPTLRWDQCDAEMELLDGGTVLSEYQRQGNVFMFNPARYVCLTPDVCGYFPRLSGFVPTGEVAVPDEALFAWALAATGSNLGRLCQTVGRLGNHAKVFWCVMDEATDGVVRSLPAAGVRSVPVRHRFSTVDGSGVLRDSKLVTDDDWSTWDEARLDFVGRGFAYVSGGDGEPGSEVFVIRGSISKGYNGQPHLNTAQVCATGTGAFASEPECIEGFGNQGGPFSFSRPVGWTGTLYAVRQGVGFEPGVRNYSDLLSDQLNQGFVAQKAP